MPQIFQVLRCYQCLVFQVQQVKKRNKWECKLCGEKQSLKKFYSIGSGKDCRINAQKLNTLHGLINEQKDNTENDDDGEETVENINHTSHLGQQKNGSKWDNYIETNPNIVESVEDESDMFIGDTKVVLEIPNKRKKKMVSNSHKNTKTFLSNSGEKCVTNSYYMENIENLNVKRENNTLLYQLENKPATAVTRKTEKFVTPTKNANSKWEKYSEETKYEDDDEDNYLLKNYPQTKNKYNNESEEIINMNIYNTFVGDRSHENSVGSLECSNYGNFKDRSNFNEFTYENIKSKTSSTNINSYLKWAKFTNDNENSSNFKTLVNKHSSDYKENVINSEGAISKKSVSSFPKTCCFQDDKADISIDKNKTTVISIFDEGDLGALDI